MYRLRFEKGLGVYEELGLNLSSPDTSRQIYTSLFISSDTT